MQGTCTQAQSPGDVQDGHSNDSQSTHLESQLGDLRGSSRKRVSNLNSYKIAFKENGDKTSLAHQTRSLVTFIAEYRSQQMFSVKNQIVNIFRSVSQPVSTQLLNSALAG